MGLGKAGFRKCGLQLLAHPTCRHALPSGMRMMISEQRILWRKAAVGISLAEIHPELGAEIRSHDDRLLFGFAFAVQQQQTTFLSVLREITDIGRGEFGLPGSRANHQRSEKVVPLAHERAHLELLQECLEIRSGEQAMPQPARPRWPRHSRKGVDGQVADGQEKAPPLPDGRQMQPL